MNTIHCIFRASFFSFVFHCSNGTITSSLTNSNSYAPFPPYTLTNEVVAVVWFHHVCATICPWTSAFDVQWWYFAHMLPLLKKNPIDFWGWGQISRSNVKFELCIISHHNSFTIWHRIRILHTCVAHNMRRTPIYFGDKRSKIKVKFWVWTLHHFAP